MVESGKERGLTRYEEHRKTEQQHYATIQVQQIHEQLESED